MLNIIYRWEGTGKRGEKGFSSCCKPLVMGQRNKAGPALEKLAFQVPSVFSLESSSGFRSLDYKICSVSRKGELINEVAATPGIPPASFLVRMES